MLSMLATFPSVPISDHQGIETSRNLFGTFKILGIQAKYSKHMIVSLREKNEEKNIDMNPSPTASLITAADGGGGSQGTVL